ncbi:DUF6600 domain-containing protein [Anditalea andensis]|uniref:Prolin-rich transmembrane protein n=1 Tax=Anditalea andensis TaxID=1048983 RepID=A0A074L401_9BACT|nr:DUF6600 domain-containing protein [Anditalea andensis]KEO74573.1 hypothetical protein EL17_02545 [Anditalea andensis]
MKTRLLNLHIAAPLLRAIFLITIFNLTSVKSAEAESIRGVSFQIFYDELMPYGDWVQDPHHGYVWIPYVEQNFHPYATRGHWVMTSYGNTWVSQYDWGWAPFHYGRWFFTDYYGWAWVPGYEWGPAWVNWRTGGGYYGWAPLGPGMHISVGFNMPYNHYVFVPQRRLIHRNIHRYYLPRTQVVNVYNHTTIINNTYVNNQRTYISGPGRKELERVNRRSIPVYKVNNTNRAGRASVSNRSVALYRPEVERGTVTQARPSRVVASTEYNRNTARSVAPRNNQRQSNVRQEANRSNSGEARSASQPSGSNVRQNAVRSKEATAPARTAAPARTSPARTEAPANTQRSAPAQNRVSSPGRQTNVNNREATPTPRQQTAQPSQRNPAPRVNAASQPAQNRQTAPAQQRQINAPAQTRQSNTAPNVRQNNSQRSAARTAAPTSVENSRRSNRSSATPQAGQSSSRSNSRSSRGNN